MINESNILNRIPRGRHQRTGIKMVTGKTPDVSEWIDFEFFDRVWYYDQKKIEIDGSGRRLVRWLSVAHRIGSDLCYWLLLESGMIIASTTVQHVVRKLESKGSTDPLRINCLTRMGFIFKTNRMMQQQQLLSKSTAT